MTGASAEPVLAEFVDAFTIRHQRIYSHPVERVWDAVTNQEHLNVWLLPTVTVEPRQGGRCSFSWGGSTPVPGIVTIFEPPKRVRYGFGDERAYIEFQLEAAGAGTRLWLTQSFPPGVLPPPGEVQQPGDDFPKPRTPWQPGFLAGFHLMLDRLPRYLDGTFDSEDTRADLDASIRGEHPQEELDLIDAYRRHIAEHCPYP